MGIGEIIENVKCKTENWGIARSQSKVTNSLILHFPFSIINFATAHAVAVAAAHTRTSPVKKSIMPRADYTKFSIGVLDRILGETTFWPFEMYNVKCRM